MAIAYSLYDNPLTPDPDDKVARMQPRGVAGLETLAREISRQEGSVDEAQVHAVLNRLTSVVEEQLLAGYTIELPGIIRLNTQLYGAFEDESAVFNPAKHRVDVQTSAAPTLRDAIRRGATLERQPAPRLTPHPVALHDLGSHTTNATLTPGNIATIAGARLKITPGHGDEGVFFLPLAGGGGAVHVTTYQRNKPSELVFLVPTLPAGQYQVEVRNRTRNGSELITGTLEDIVTV